jgi:hypothetical protein
MRFRPLPILVCARMGLATTNFCKYSISVLLFYLARPVFEPRGEMSRHRRSSNGMACTDCEMAIGITLDGDRSSRLARRPT